MADVLIIHQGFTLSEDLEHEAREHGADATVGTARLGPEATYDQPHPDHVITDDATVASFWEEKGVSVEYRGGEEAAEKTPTTSAPEPESPEAEIGVDQTTAVSELEDEYTIQERGGGWYDVVGPDGETQNEDALRKDDAHALADELNE